MRIAGAAFALVLSIGVGQADAFTCAPPRCSDVAVPVPSGLTVPESAVRIFLPADYATSGKSYPLLLLLHGAGDTYKTWSENTDVYAFTADQDLIVVMPDSGRNSNAGWYSDWFDGSRQWESFHIGVLLPWIEQNYRTLGDGHRAIAGLSMGGFGTMHYAARYPGLFSAAASFSGAVDTLYGFPASGVAFTALHDQFGTPNDSVWGNQITNYSNWAANDPATLAANLAGTKLWIATGDGVPGLSALSPALGGPPSSEDPGNPGGYLIEQFIFQMNLSFILHLDLAGVPHTDWLYPGGLHSWPYWEADLHWALPELMEVIH